MGVPAALWGSQEHAPVAVEANSLASHTSWSLVTGLRHIIVTNECGLLRTDAIFGPMVAACRLCWLRPEAGGL